MATFVHGGKTNLRRYRQIHTLIENDPVFDREVCGPRQSPPPPILLVDQAWANLRLVEWLLTHTAGYGMWRQERHHQNQVERYERGCEKAVHLVKKIEQLGLTYEDLTVSVVVMAAWHGAE